MAYYPVGQVRVVNREVPISAYMVEPNYDIISFDQYTPLSSVMTKWYCGYCHALLSKLNMWQEEDQLALFRQYNDCGHIFAEPRHKRIKDWMDLPIPGPSELHRAIGLPDGYTDLGLDLDGAYRRAQELVDYTRLWNILEASKPVLSRPFVLPSFEDPQVHEMVTDPDGYWAKVYAKVHIPAPYRMSWLEHLDNWAHHAKLPRFIQSRLCDMLDRSYGMTETELRRANDVAEHSTSGTYPQGKTRP